MLKNKPVRVCDECEDRIAKLKCEICGKDLCKDCEFYTDNGLFGYEELFVNDDGDAGISTCEKCEKIVVRCAETKKFWKEVLRESKLKEVVLNKLKDRLVLYNLGKKHGEEDEDD